MTPSIRLGVIGDPIAHSLSPVMHRAALDALGRSDVSYEAIAVEAADLAPSLVRLAGEGFVGLNVTLPHKTSVIAHCVSLDENARALGAVNTLVRERGAWIGANTDVVGLTRSLAESEVRVQGARAVVLGAGGASRASVVALESAREVIVVARRSEAAAEVARLHPRGRALAFADLGAAIAGADVLVQASSAMLSEGAQDFARAVPLHLLAPDAVVIDLVYRPRETALLARARASGLRVVDGVGMLVHQGAASLERWIGQKPSVEAMRAAVLIALA